jgi:hypothetical protein
MGVAAYVNTQHAIKQASVSERFSVSVKNRPTIIISLLPK